VRPYLKNNQRQKGWRHGSNGRTSTGFEFKSPILLRKKKGRKKRKKKKEKEGEDLESQEKARQDNAFI
jgi:hypothetical protein